MNLSLLAERWDGHRWTAEATPAVARGVSASFAGVSCSSSDACTAVGSYGARPLPLVERWNGRRWSVQRLAPSPGGASLNAVSCPAAGACFAVGQRGPGSLAERWDGRRWSVQSTPATGDSTDTLYGVSCISPTTCTAVGGSNTSATQVLLAERWNGRHWSIQRPPNVGGNGDSLHAVSCPSRGSCTASGNYAVPSSCNSTTCYYPEPLAERWTRR